MTNSTGNSAILWGRNGFLEYWDITGDIFFPMQGHDQDVLGAMFLSRGRKAVSWSLDGSLMLWDLESGESGTPIGIFIRGPQPGLAEQNMGRDLMRYILPKCAPLMEGEKFLSWGVGNDIDIWAVTGKHLTTLRYHSAPVTDLVVYPDGVRAISWEKQGNHAIWNL